MAHGAESIALKGRLRCRPKFQCDLSNALNFLNEPNLSYEIHEVTVNCISLEPSKPFKLVEYLNSPFVIRHSQTLLQFIHPVPLGKPLQLQLIQDTASFDIVKRIAGPVHH